MKLSTERIPTTRVGSLPRARSLLDLILAKEEGRRVDLGHSKDGRVPKPRAWVTTGSSMA